MKRMTKRRLEKRRLLKGRRFGQRKKDQTKRSEDDEPTRTEEFWEQKKKKTMKLR
jgi:hypothetical protein